MRVVTGAIAAVLTGFVGGVIMGEYELRGLLAIVAGLLFGLAIAEVAITAGKTDDVRLVAITGAVAFLGITYAAYIDAGGDYVTFDSGALGRIAGMRWVGSLVALASAAWWVRSFGSRGVRNPMRPDYESQEPT